VKHFVIYLHGRAVGETAGAWSDVTAEVLVLGPFTDRWVGVLWTL
jgi:hypothetical protein